MNNKNVFKLGVLLLVLVSFTSFAFADGARLGDLMFVAWRDDGELFVAIGNDGVSRKNVTITVEIRDDEWRPVFEETRFAVGGDFILLDVFSSSAVRRASNLVVTAREGYRSVNIPIQTISPMVDTGKFVVEANSVWDVYLDLEFLLTGERSRLEFSDYYSIMGSGSRGRIQLKTLEGGLKYNASTNSIEYGRPYAILSMRAPNTNGISMMTFDAYKISDGYRGRREKLDTPTVLVYGRNIRVIDDTGRSRRESPPMIKL